jgi:hypothetical protein
MKTTARNIVSTLLIALSALAISGTANAANLISNGSFELGPDGTTPYAKTWSAPVNWVSLGGGDTQFGPASAFSGLTPPDGSYVSLIGGTASFTGGIATSWFSLTQGQQYTFSFDSAGQAAFTSAWTPVAWEQWKMGLAYSLNYKDGALMNTAAVEGVAYPVAINSWNTTSVSFTAAQSGLANVEVFTYKNGWTPNGYVYSGVDNFKLEAAAVPEPSTYALVVGGIATLLLIRRRVQA